MKAFGEVSWLQALVVIGDENWLGKYYKLESEQEGKFLKSTAFQLFREIFAPTTSSQPLLSYSNRRILVSVASFISTNSRFAAYWH